MMKELSSDKEYKLSDLNTWVEKYEVHLMRFASSKIRDKSVLEDLVQEAFLAGIKSAKTFKGQSSEKSWLIGILHHKIMDYYRKSKRHASINEFRGIEDGVESLFDYQKKINSCRVGDPVELLENKELLNEIKFYLKNMSEKSSLIFAMHELDGVSTEDICSELNLTPSNVRVTLFRTRIKLKKHLQRELKKA